MMRIGAAGLMALAGVCASIPAASAGPAQTAPSVMRVAQAAPPDEPTPRHLRRPPTRLRVYPNYQAVPEVYPRYFPGPNAVRECNAFYAQEYRPSGTVIVPHMSCHWRPG